MSEAREESAVSGLWSLTDLIRFYAGVISSALSMVARSAGLAAHGHATPGDLAEDLRRLRAELDSIGASPVVIAEADRAIGTAESMPVTASAPYCISLLLNVQTDLSQRYYYRVLDENVQYLTRDSFVKSAPAFPDAKSDMRAASRCLAFEESNACVFHCMRVLEHGLRKLASHVGVADFQLENWKNIIDQIEKKIREMEALPKSPEKSENLRKLSEAAVQFRYFKDAWRNHVSHGHTWYDQDQARSVFNHVRQFMEALAG